MVSISFLVVVLKLVTLQYEFFYHLHSFFENYSLDKFAMNESNLAVFDIEQADADDILAAFEKKGKTSNFNFGMFDLCF